MYFRKNAIQLFVNLKAIYNVANWSLKCTEASACIEMGFNKAALGGLCISPPFTAHLSCLEKSQWVLFISF